jgi:O-antigen/teichoic acid export membrane protein
MFAEQILRIVAGLLVGIWVARYLGPAQFGIFSYVIAFTALFGSIAKLGLDSIVVRDLVREPNQRDLCLGTAFWLKLIGALAMLAVMAIAVQQTSNDITTNLYIFIIAAGTIFHSFDVVDFYFQSKTRSKSVSICKFTQVVISSLLKIYLIFTGADLLWFVLVSLLDQVTLAVSLYIAYRYQKLGSFYRHFDLTTAKKLLRDTWPLLISGFFIMIYMRIDLIMIKEMLGEKEAGLYSAATRISEMFYFIPMLLTNSLFPSIVNSKKVSEDLYYARLQRLYTLMVWAAMAIALPMTLLSGWLLTILFGEAYRDAGPVLSVHIWAGVFVFLGVASSKWLITEGLQKYSAINALIGAVANVLLNLLLIPKYGICGAAISTVLSQSIASHFVNFLFQDTRKNFYRMSRALISYK